MKTLIKSKNKKVLTKLSLAMSVLLLGTIASPSLFAAPSDKVEKQQMVEIHIDSDGNHDMADIVMNIDGEVIKLKLPKSALGNNQALEDALSDVPEDIRARLITTLTAARGDNAELHIEHEVSVEAGINADTIIRLMKGANFSNDDLDKIQQVLDAKR